MADNTGMLPVTHDLLSNSLIGLTQESGDAAFVAGAICPDDAWYDFRISADREGLKSLEILIRLEGVKLAARASRRLSPIRLYCGHSLSRLMNSYAEDVAERMVTADRFRSPPTGWCSWYHYYGTDDVDDIRRNMRAITNSSLKDRLQVIQIDDGWNLPERDSKRCWGDWIPGCKYPEGIRSLVDEIHGEGFLAGLWLAPFSVDQHSRLFNEHPEWVVREYDSEGNLIPVGAEGGVFGLDLTHPDVQDFVRQTFRKVFDEWNVDYIKIDFLMHSTWAGVRHDPSKTGVEAFRTGMRIIREEAGKNRFILACGSPIGAAVGLCDGMRVGMDVGGRWYFGLNPEAWQHGNCCLKAAANSAFWRQWMHRIWWQNDPDCIVLRDQASQNEVDFFTRYVSQIGLEDAGNFDLSREEALAWLRLVWMSGGMFVLSDDLTRFSSENWKLLREFCEVNPHPVRWIDEYRSRKLGLLRSCSGPLTVCLFNFSDEPLEPVVEVEKLDISERWSFEERFCFERFSGSGSSVRFPQLPGRTCRIWVLSGDEKELR